MNKLFSKYFIVVIIAALGFGLQWKYLNEFPSHIHAWAQSDRYALAIGFTRNGFDFFHPQTFVMNHQFPARSKLADKTVITAVDFPVHEYVAGILMNLSGTLSPWCFRLYTLIYSLIGLFFLFRISELLLHDRVRSTFVVIFAATSPVFLYYQAGFLPGVPSIANGFIGLYLYLQYLKTESQKSYFLSLLFLTLASLSRLPFSILLIAIIIHHVFQSFRIKKYDKGKLLGILIAILVIAGYFLYNLYLRNKYGSIFLNYILPAKTFREFIQIIKEIYKNWFFQYFTLIHYVVFGILLILAAISWVVFRLKTETSEKQVVFILLWILAGAGLYSLLMIRQFTAHDYYFLDTFYIPYILVLILILKHLPRMNKVFGFAFSGVLALISVLFIMNGAKSQESRRVTGFWDRTEMTLDHFRDSKKFLDSISISPSARMLVLDAYAPNIPFIGMDRTGYAVLTTSRKNIESALKWNYDYIVIQNAYFLSDIYPNDPGIINKIDKVAGNGKITVYKKAIGTANRSLYDFLELTGKQPILKQELTCEPGSVNTWQNINPTAEYAHNGKNSGLLTAKNEYGITLRIKDPRILTGAGRLLFFRGYFLRQQPVNECLVVVAFTSAGKTLYYNSYDLKDFIRFYKTWHQVDLFFQLPEIENQQGELSVYLWNTGRNEVFYDDVSVSIY